MDTAAAKMAGGPRGKCRYTMLCLAYGVNGAPSIRLIRETFMYYFKTLAESQITLGDVRVAWGRIRNRLLSKLNDYRRIHPDTKIFQRVIFLKVSRGCFLI